MSPYTWDIDEDATTADTSDDPNPYVEVNGGIFVTIYLDCGGDLKSSNSSVIGGRTTITGDTLIIGISFIQPGARHAAPQAQPATLSLKLFFLDINPIHY